MVAPGPSRRAAGRRRAAPPQQAPATVPQLIDESAPIFVISVAAQLAGMHPQTLRGYDRMGLVSPRRTSGRGRRYSRRDVEQLRLIQFLSQDQGVNLEGIRRIIHLESELRDLQRRYEELSVQHRALSELLATLRLDRVFAADAGGSVQLSRTRGSGW